MATLAFENQNTVLTRSRVDWGAIWAGVFTFIGIWSVFGMLGAAIFASSANPNAARPISGMGWGMSIWAIMLTIIAMWFAGMETGRLAAGSNRHDSVLHGMTMFGLSMAAALIIVVLGGLGFSGNAESAVHSPYFLDVLSGLGWAGFLSLFLGWLAAMGGASVGARPKVVVEKNVQPMRNAA
ncbi:MAG TPA: hypothetical protein VKQ11_11105 [Candidatus Sulfotelmatobacter sp.]|nr:hypothetical protein [Candidatus Sulfotelmatobacter sp.]